MSWITFIAIAEIADFSNILASSASMNTGGRYIPPETIRALADTFTSGETGPPGAAWYPGGEVDRLIGDYQTGQLSLDDLTDACRDRTWAAIARDWAADELGPARDAVDDLEPVIADTFDDVVHAYDRGAITTADYAVLVQPAARSRR